MIERSYNDSRSRRRWLCECSCGNRKVVRDYDLLNGRSTKCINCKNGNHLYMMESKERKKYLDYISKAKRVYLISEQDIRDRMDNQQGCCEICKRSLDHQNRTFHIDHDHQTSNVRGLLCSNCNKSLGLIRDSISSAVNMVNYLNKYSEVE